MDQKDLKIAALTERIGKMASEYEDKVADLRVLLTVSEAQREELQKSLVELSEVAPVPEANVFVNPDEVNDIVDGEVVNS